MKFNLRPNIGALTFMMLLIMLLVIIGPLLTIWALNNLFALTIEYSLTNWAAVVILHAFFTTAISAKSKS